MEHLDAHTVNQASQKIEKCLIELYNDSQDQFYAHLFFNVNRSARADIPTMGVGLFNDTLRLVYNPQFTLQHDNELTKTILKHEALHIICNHVTKFHTSRQNPELHALWNIAMDCAINQLLDYSHIEKLEGVTLERFKTLLKYTDKDLVIPNQTHQYYFDLLKQEKDKREENGDLDKLKEMLEKMQMDSHEGDGQPVDAVTQAMIDSILKDAARKAGNKPSYLEELLAPLFEAQVDWATELKNFIVYTTKCNKKTTRSRRNRRFGIKVAGKRHDFVSRILVVLDTSGSMSGKRTELALAELSDIAMNSPEAKIDVCEADTEIKDVFEYSGGEIKISGRGGTDMQPAFNYAVEEGYDAIICISDMEYYSELRNPMIDVLFVCTANEEGKMDFGRVLHVRE